MEEPPQPAAAAGGDGGGDGAAEQAEGGGGSGGGEEGFLDAGDVSYTPYRPAKVRVSCCIIFFLSSVSRRSIWCVQPVSVVMRLFTARVCSEPPTPSPHLLHSGKA